ncbi:hypothetical protein [Streptomyces sp. NPDC046939]|uniref:hypothetical protein n=1 Tax=Streptomyces sp. NPDC046939 TaxID=3155376 RepID=UPI0033D4A527
MTARPAAEPGPGDDRSDRYHVRTHAVSGQVIIGRHNTASQTAPGAPATPPVTAGELASLRAEFAHLRTLVPEDEPQAGRARELLEELEETVSATGEPPDVSTMRYVVRWFRRSLPALATAVTGLVLHPVVGRLVEAAGDTLVEDFHRYFDDI